MGSLLKECAFRRPGKRNHVPDVGHARNELNEAFETEPEAGVRNRSEAPEVEIPAVRLRVDALLLHPGLQDVEAVLPLAAADQLARSRHEHVHGPDGPAVIVHVHVKGLVLTRVVVNDDRSLKHLLREVSFVFGLQIFSSFGRIFKRLA